MKWHSEMKGRTRAQHTMCKNENKMVRKSVLSNEQSGIRME